MHTYRGHIAPNLLHIPEHEIYHDLHELVKLYPHKSKLILYKNENIQRKAGYEDSLPVLPSSKDTYANPQATEDSLDRSIRRSRQLITDVVLCNDFELFATFTFKKDRQDIDLCKRKMSTWLKNQKRIHGVFKYLIVPEFHKDGKSLHFHALLQNYRGNLTDSGKYINSRKAYNFGGYQSGHTTAVKIDNMEAVSLYIRKYITKDMPTFAGKKRFWLSTGLNRPVTLINQNYFEKSELNWGILHNNEVFTLYESNEIIQLPS